MLLGRVSVCNAEKFALFSGERCICAGAGFHNQGPDVFIGYYQARWCSAAWCTFCKGDRFDKFETLAKKEDKR